MTWKTFSSDCKSVCALEQFIWKIEKINTTSNLNIGPVMNCQANSITKCSTLFHGVKRRSNELHSLSLRINKHYIVDLPRGASSSVALQHLYYD